jgi:type IV pilus assembly protein PilP
MNARPSQNTVKTLSRFQAQIRWSVAFVCVWMISGCSNDFSDLEQYVATTRTKFQGSVEPLPQFEPYQNYVYSTFNYRTPFTEPSAAEPDDQEGDAGPRPDKDRRKEPLEFFPLDSLKMVGTLERGGETWGLIRDPDGTIHRVQAGNHAGENFGEILRISESSVDLLEIIPDGLGAWIEREISLLLGEE